MKKLLPLVVVLGVFVYASRADATETTGTIGGWATYTDGSFSFYLAGGPQLCTNGTFGENHRGSVITMPALPTKGQGNGPAGTTADGVKTLLSVVQSAFLSGQKVII